MDVGTGTETWRSPAWRELAVTWLDEQLAAAGIERTGDVSQPHLWPWATALTATTHGRVWLKAAGPGTAFEVGLYEVLRQVAPDRVLAPIASCARRGWIILSDGGTRLREAVGEDELVDALVVVLPRYAELQRRLEPAVDALPALGVPDMRAHVMPARFAEALEVTRDDVERRGSTADRATHDRLRDLSDTFGRWCEALVAAPGAPSLDHNDLHPGNILLPDGGGLDGARLYDWGDSVVTHPFASMRIPLGWVQSHRPRDVPRVRDAYLEVFGDVAPHARLVAVLELACHVGKVTRALTWVRALRQFGPNDPERFVGAPLETLAALLDESYLGGA